jgi:hypothetical protein
MERFKHPGFFRVLFFARSADRRPIFSRRSADDQSTISRPQSICEFPIEINLRAIAMGDLGSVILGAEVGVPPSPLVHWDHHVRVVS